MYRKILRESQAPPIWPIARDAREVLALYKTGYQETRPEEGKKTGE